MRRGATANDTQQMDPGDTGTMKPVTPENDTDEDALFRELASENGEAHHDNPAAEEGEVAMETPPRRNKAKWLIAGMVAAVACVVIGVAWVVFRTDAQSEAERFRKGMGYYAAGQNEKAASIFSGLAADFPDSDSKETYEFLYEFSDLRARIFNFKQGNNPAENIKALADWLKNQSKNPTFAKYKDDVGKTYAELLDRRFEAAERDLNQADSDVIDQELEDAAPYVPDERVKALRDKLGDIRVAIARKLLREELIKELKALLDKPRNDMDERAEGRIAEARPELPGIDKDAEIQKLLKEILEARRRLVVWREADVPLERAAEDGEPALWVCTHLDGREAPAAPGRIVFALARGVLYALDQGTGQVRWATRVGVDTTTLPVRITALDAELALVLSSDTNTLTVREVRTGKPRWQLRLSAPCLGRPLVVGPKAYLPTYDGRVYEIDLNAGRQVGWFELGKPLSLGGCLQEGTNLLYFPADERYVFVLDVVARKCLAMLRSEHPAGSLRSEPVVISRFDQRRDRNLEETAFPDYLILSQASGLDSMKLRVFPLPIAAGEGKPTVLGPEPEVPGWSWFPPLQNCERIVQVTDEGVLGLVGINQFRNQDKDLFLEMKYPIPPDKKDEGKGRAQVVHVSEDDVWVLARGGLRLWHFDRYGPNLLPLWQQPLRLGSPLHAAQVDEGRAMVLVTQSPQEPICKITAISPAADRDTGEVRWQKQLGVLCRGEPVTLGDKVLLLDQSGGLFQFNPKEHAGGNGWESAGQRVVPPLAAAPRGPYLLPAEDGKAVDLVALSPLGRLVVRRYEPGKKIELHSYGSFGLPSSPPARLSKGLVLAMEKDGLLVFLPADGKGAGDRGQEWRAPHADRDVPGFVTALGGDEFVSTDGSRGMTRRRWSGGRDFEEKTSSEDLSARIVTPPLVLPPAKNGDIRLCAADANGVLTLWSDTAAGGKGQKWKRETSWQLQGRITAGPFPLGKHIGCIVDRRRLVCIDLAKDDNFAWQYQDERHVIVGTPHVANGELLLALQSGTFVALDATTGQPKAPGYRLKANVAPMATPVPFGNGRFLAPLSDGTLMILRYERCLENPKR